MLENARAWAETIEPDAVSASLIGLIDAAQDAVAPATPTAPEPDQLIALGLTFAEVAISVVSLLALIYFWLTERARLQRFALAMLPADRRSGAREAWNQIELRLGGWVRGQLILMGSVGVGDDDRLLRDRPRRCPAARSAGSAVRGDPAHRARRSAPIPALVVAASTGRIEIVILVAVVYFVIQLVEGNVLVPMVMHNTIGIPPFIVFVSILAGAAIAGIPGALLAVPDCGLDHRRRRAPSGARRTCADHSATAIGSRRARRGRRLDGALDQNERAAHENNLRAGPAQVLVGH